MGLFEQFPYQNFHELNLDWLIQQMNMVKDSVVLSVNGQTGDVILYPEAFVRLPDLSDTTTWSFYRYADNNAEGIQFINGQPMQRIDGLNRYDVFDSGNPPPYPVTAVNGQTGDVVIAVPVRSVNGMTGDIILYQNASIEFPAINTESWEMWRETATNNALGIKFTTGQPIKRINNGLEYTVYDSENQPPYPVESVAGLTGAVAILNTQIVTDQGQQKIQIVFPVNSVDGQTGSVNTWGYTNNATTKLPLAAPADLWNLTRDINSGNIGLRFTYDSVNGSRAYLVFNDGTNPESALRLLTPADIPSSSGVVSINGQTGVVNLYAAGIQMSSTDNTLVEDAINNNAADITDLQGDIIDIQGELNTFEPFNKKANISFPYTATHSGIVSFQITRDEANPGTIVVKEVRIDDSDGNTFRFSSATVSAWASTSGVFPVIKGKTYTVVSGSVYDPFITYHDET